jgi:hypothetical protein
MFREEHAIAPEQRATIPATAAPAPTYSRNGSHHDLTDLHHRLKIREVREIGDELRQMLPERRVEEEMRRDAKWSLRLGSTPPTPRITNRGYARQATPLAFRAVRLSARFGCPRGSAVRATRLLAPFAVRAVRPFAPFVSLVKPAW